MYFDSCRTADDAKSMYRRLAKIHHPDLGGDTAIMAAINAEYARFTCRRPDYSTSYQTWQEQPKTKKTATRKPRKKTYYSNNAINDYIKRTVPEGAKVWYGIDTIVIVQDGFQTVVAHAEKNRAGESVWTVRKYNKTPEKYAKYF